MDETHDHKELARQGGPIGIDLFNNFKELGLVLLCGIVNCCLLVLHCFTGISRGINQVSSRENSGSYLTELFTPLLLAPHSTSFSILI